MSIAVSQLAYGQEILLQGRVTDSLSAPLPFSQVLVKDTPEGSILAFGSSNQEGHYQIRLNTSQDSVWLNVRRIGFENYARYISIKEAAEGQLTYDIVMVEKSTELDEVVIEGNRPVRERGDTLTYQVEAFTDGTEEVAEDVLKKIPGVNVSEDGTIQYQGKEIKKILLDGDDLTDTKYKVLSKNLSAELLAEVEILKNYTDNRLFKGIEQSEDVAINLKIKEGRKAPLFGEVEAGGGINEVYTANTDLLSYRKGFKAIFTGDLNNIGQDAIGSDWQRFNTGNLEYKQFRFSEPLLDTRLSGPGFIREELLRFHDSRYGSLNFVAKPTQRLSIRTMTSLYGNDIRYRTDQNVSYPTSGTGVNLNESQDQEIALKETFADLKATYQVNANADLQIRTHYTQNQQNLSTQNLLNGNLIPDRLDNENSVALFDVSLTNRINPCLALQTQVSYLEDDLSQQYRLSMEGEEQLQLSRQNSRNTGASSTLKALWKGYAINGVLGVTDLRQSLVTSLEGGSENPGNDLGYEATSLFSELLLKRELKKVEFTAGGRLRQEYFSLGEEEANRTFFEPVLGVSSQLDRFNKVGLLYTKEYSLSSIYELYRNPILQGYRYLSSNAIDFAQPMSDQSVVFYLKHNDSEKRFINAFVRALYVRSSPVASFAATVEEDGRVIDQQRLFGESQTYSLSTGFDRYFPKLSSVLKLSYQADYREIPGLLNSEDQVSRLRNHRLQFSMGSAFDGFFNFGLSASMNRSSADYGNGDNSFYFGRFNQKLIFKPNTRWNAILEAEQLTYFSEDGNSRSFTPLGSVAMNYTIKPNKATLSLNLSNLFNRQTAVIQSVSALSAAQSTYYLLPRYLMLSLKYRF